MPAGSEGENHAPTTPAGVHLPLGRPTQCEPFRELNLARLDQRLSAQRIWQDLAAEHGFTGSNDSVKRFVRKLGAATPLPFRRMECGPGEEAQVDFGTGAPVIGADGKRRKAHVFRIILSHSRQGYSEAMLTVRGIEGTRVLQGLLALTKKHPDETLETACEIALSHGCFRLRTIRQLLQRETAKQEPLPFLDEHPLISSVTLSSWS